MQNLAILQLLLISVLGRLNVFQPKNIKELFEDNKNSKDGIMVSYANYGFVPYGT